MNAGRFYPGDAHELRRVVEQLLSAVPAGQDPCPKAIIVPHAGYIYSGPIAASAYARLRPGRGMIERIVLLGPAHHVEGEGVAVSSAGIFDTPLGGVAVDVKAVARLRELPQVALLDAAHAREHSLEVQLPFLQVVLGNFLLVPLAVGEAAAEEVSQVLEAVWGGPETCIVVSSDLSHYYDAQVAQRLDRATATAIERLAPESVGDEAACGGVPIRGLLQAARSHGLAVRTLDLRNSGDTAGPRDRVVGYGAFAFA